MILAIPFPDLSPELFSISLGGFDFALRWYALAYIAGIVGGWWMARYVTQQAHLWPRNEVFVTKGQIEDLMTWIILAIVLGGRLGYVIFYQPGYYLQNPLEALAIWQGGMSFHGGMIATGLVVIGYAMRHGIPIRSLLDVGGLAAPLGLGLGRLANFVNAELWGRPTDVPWAVIFPGAEAQACSNLGELCARHPSQLYEAVLEGLVLLVLLWVLAYRGALKVPGLICGLFLGGYGLARFVVEFYRQPDAQYITAANPAGYVIGWDGWGLTMGQVLSLPMLVAGFAAAAFVWRSHRARARTA